MLWIFPLSARFILYHSFDLAITSYYIIKAIYAFIKSCTNIIFYAKNDLFYYLFYHRFSYNCRKYILFTLNIYTNPMVAYWFMLWLFFWGHASLNLFRKLVVLIFVFSALSKHCIKCKNHEIVKA